MNDYEENNKNEGFMEKITSKETFIETVKKAMESLYSNCKIQVTNVSKNNDINYTALTIHTNESNIAPVIYLDSYYDEYKAGKSLSKICLEIKSINFSYNRNENFDVHKVIDFECAKDRICLKLINKERNEDLLKNTPYIEYLDLAITMFVLISEDEKGVASITVKEWMLDLWGKKDLNELLSLAITNSRQLFPVEIQSVEDFLFSDLCVWLGDDDNKDIQNPMYVATNAQNLNGAHVILYEDLLETFAEKIGTNFFILPSSIHELIFYPDNDTMSVHELKSIVNAVNVDAILPEEFLSNTIYLYHADTNCVEMMEFI